MYCKATFVLASPPLFENYHLYLIGKSFPPFHGWFPISGPQTYMRLCFRPRADPAVGITRKCTMRTLPHVGLPILGGRSPPHGSYVSESLSTTRTRPLDFAFKGGSEVFSPTHFRQSNYFSFQS